MTKEEKIKSWLIEQGYKASVPYDVGVLWADKRGVVYIYNETSLNDILRGGDFSHFLGIAKEGQFIPLPDFQDDQPEPKDKALQEWIDIITVNGHPIKEVRVLEEINERLKSLEAANEKA